MVLPKPSPRFWQSVPINNSSGAVPLKEKVLSEKARGKLILVTSHILSDLEEITTDVLYLMDGQVQFYQSIQQLKTQTGEERLNRAIARVMRGNESLN